MIWTQEGKPVDFPNYKDAFRRFYQSKAIDYYDDQAVVDFLKEETGYTHNSAQNVKQERNALELVYLADLLDKPQFFRLPENGLPKRISS